MATTATRTNGSPTPPVNQTNSPSSAPSLKAKIKNDEEFVFASFPEFLGNNHETNVALVTAQVKDPNQAYKSDTKLEDLLTAEGLANIQAVKADLQAKGINNPKILSIIDLQNSFLDGGSLQVTGGQAKAIPALKELLAENKRRIVAGEEPLFHVIVMTKDLHPADHKSFTGNFFELAEKKFDGKKGFELTLNGAGANSGVVIRDIWKNIPPFKDMFTFPNTSNPHTIALVPKDSANYAEFKKRIQNGTLMPLTMGLHPISVTPHMFRNVKIEGMDSSQIWQKLQNMSLLMASAQAGPGVIRPDFSIDGVRLCDAFSSDPANAFGPTVFKENFAQGFAKAFFGTQANVSAEQLAQAKAILGALLENFWPHHCVQGTDQHQFNQELVEALAGELVIGLPKGTSAKLGESYSGGLNTAGYLATPYIPVLQYLDPEVNIVCGTATGFCPSGCAFDSAKFGIKTRYWVAASKGLTEGDEEATHQALEKAGIEVSDSFTGRVGSDDMLLDRAFLNPVGANQTYEVLQVNKGKYSLMIQKGTDLSLGKAEEAARCLRTFLTSDLSKTYLSADQKASLVAHVTVIDNVIEKYNDSVRNSGVIWFFTIVLAILTLGMYILRDKLIRPTIANLLPADFKDAASLISARKEIAQVTKARKEAFNFLEAQDSLEGDEAILGGRLVASKDAAPVLKTEALVKSFAELKLDTIESLSLVESMGDMERLEQGGISLIGPQVESCIAQAKDTTSTHFVVVAKLKDGTTVRFGTLPGEVSLETLEFASDMAVNAACAKVIEKYKEVAEDVATRKKALALLSAQQRLDQREEALAGALQGLQHAQPMPKTQQLVEEVAKHKLDTITSTVVYTREPKQEIPDSKGLLFEAGRLVATLEGKEDFMIEATRADNSKVTFGMKEGELPLALLQFASEMALNAECAKAIAKYSEKK